MEKEKVKKGWEERGFSFSVWVDPPGQCWDDFSHDSDELFILVKGEVKMILDGKTFMAEIGKEVFIPKGTIHSVHNVGNSHSVWYYGYN